MHLLFLCPFQGNERIDPDSWTRHAVSGSFNRYLKIRRVDASSDGGSYICKGINGFGTSSFEFVVDVRGGADGDGESGESQILPDLDKAESSAPLQNYNVHLRGQ